MSLLLLLSLKIFIIFIYYLLSLVTTEDIFLKKEGFKNSVSNDSWLLPRTKILKSVIITIA